ncbi:hypothetical protein [Streptomyces lucensis]|uniref:hypothetical protein n=1 Tax=Streptomyces lucensis TaxID=67319 RepID=UPI00167587EE|nr:hypothetical protein [Streptomyces lucensis]
MLRILDARTGDPVAAAPARRGLTRVEAHAHGLDLTALRVLLTADLLVRALELGGTPVWTTLDAPHRNAELRAAAATLSIRPFEDGRDLASGLGEAQAIHIVAQEGGRVPAEGPVMAVAPARWTRARSGPSPSGDAPGPSSDPGSVQETEPPSGAFLAPPPDDPVSPPAAPLADPAALRLALLSVPRGAPVRLDRAVLDGAAQRLARWRGAAAGWARQPSRPVPGEVRARLRDAWEDDLDLPAVLEVLRDVESDRHLPDGARFETFVYADRLLALDLSSALGSPA